MSAVDCAFYLLSVCMNSQTLIMTRIKADNVCTIIVPGLSLCFGFSLRNLYKLTIATNVIPVIVIDIANGRKKPTCSRYSAPFENFAFKKKAAEFYYTAL